VVLDVDGEIGGNDQLFNMLTGRTLLKKIKNKEKFVITVKLLADTTGEKMGKTTGNMIALSDHPNDMFGKVMSWNDGMIVPGFELCTDYSIAQIETIKKRLSQGENPRDLKLLLAFEITKTVVGEKMAQKAQDHFIALFQKGEHSGDVIKIQTRGTLKETIIAAGVVHSSGELRTLVEGGAVVFVSNNKKMTIPDLSIKPEKGLYRIGKHRFCEII
jgi:tyrosyl-tRNA synthetase